MSDNIHWVYEGLIINRDLVNEKIGEIVAHVKANEVGALIYEYCLNEDEDMLTIYERYANNEAVLAHGDNMQPYVYFFEEAVQVKKFIVFGPVSAKVKELLSGFGAEFQKPLAGFVR
tara:strand:+ start:278 stop:628 length:351 start_codon:yes stop_codon:yes gene_type:complete